MTQLAYGQLITYIVFLWRYFGFRILAFKMRDIIIKYCHCKDTKHKLIDWFNQPQNLCSRHYMRLRTIDAKVGALIKHKLNLHHRFK